MSDFCTIGELQLKADMFRPQVLNAYRSGNLSYQSMWGVSNPMQDVYLNTYKYITVPEYPSNDALQLVSASLGKPITQAQASTLSYSDKRGAIQQLLLTGGSPMSSLTARSFPPQK